MKPCRPPSRVKNIAMAGTAAWPGSAKRCERCTMGKELSMSLRRRIVMRTFYRLSWLMVAALAVSFLVDTKAQSEDKAKTSQLQQFPAKASESCQCRF